LTIIVVAGPILAIQIQEYFEKRREQRRRKPRGTINIEIPCPIVRYPF